jgi:hypothetical protein
MNKHPMPSNRTGAPVTASTVISELILAPPGTFSREEEAALHLVRGLLERAAYPLPGRPVTPADRLDGLRDIVMELAAAAAGLFTAKEVDALHKVRVVLDRIIGRLRLKEMKERE